MSKYTFHSKLVIIGHIVITTTSTSVMIFIIIFTTGTQLLTDTQRQKSNVHIQRTYTAYMPKLYTVNSKKYATSSKNKYFTAIFLYDRSIFYIKEVVIAL